jgi:hypothetical protein
MATVAEQVFAQPITTGQSLSENVQGGLKTGIDVAMKMKEAQLKEAQLAAQKQKYELEAQAQKLAIGDQGLNRFLKAATTDDPKLKAYYTKSAQSYLDSIGQPVDPEILKWATSDNKVRQQLGVLVPKLNAQDIGTRSAAFYDMMQLLGNDPEKLADSVSKFTQSLVEQESKTQRAVVIAAGNAQGKLNLEDIRAKRAAETLKSQQEFMRSENEKNRESNAARDKARYEAAQAAAADDRAFQARQKELDRALKEKLGKKSLGADAFKQTVELSKQYNSELKDAVTIVNTANKILAFDKAPADLRESGLTGAGVYTLISKAFDPTTGVREGELRKFESAGLGIGEQIRQTLKGWYNGERLTPQQWKVVRGVTEIYAKEAQDQIAAHKARTTPFLQKNSINPDDVYLFAPGLKLKAKPKTAPAGTSPSASSAFSVSDVASDLSDDQKTRLMGLIKKGQASQVRDAIKKKYQIELNDNQLNEVLK